MSPPPDHDPRDPDAAQSAFVSALLDPAAPPPPDIAPTAGSPSIKRFNVYRNNVVVSLIGALGQAFPALKKLVGDARFQSMAAQFVRARPPRSPVMIHYGEDLPHWLDHAFPPARKLPYLSDLARLELARRSAYHAADAVALTAGDVQAALAGAAPDAIAAARFQVHPAVRLLCSDWAVVSLWAALQDSPTPSALMSAVEHKPQAAIIARPALELTMRSASPGISAFLGALAATRSVAEAAAEGARAGDFDLSVALSVSIDDGCFTEVLI